MVTHNKLRILLADDHTLFRQGLVALLSRRPNIKVVGEAENGQEAIDLARELGPDLILMDIQMPVCSGLEAVKRIKKEMPDIPIVMLSAFDDDEDLFAAIKYGADGYLLKNLNVSQLVDLVEGMNDGVAPISRVLADRIFKEFRNSVTVSGCDGEKLESLTPGEIETLEMLVKGYTNQDIAGALHISGNTVKLHLRNIMQKLHFQNRTQLAIYALQKNLVRNGP
jgi:two-component system, NarL family, nitrate/nitrite response regulator NarL